MIRRLPPLPVSEPNFANLRQDGNLYIDKTGFLQRLIEEGRWYFLARPRRFGKSLTVSTLEAMFKGRTDLFAGLKAEAWVTEQAKHPSPVVHLDLSLWDSTGTPKALNEWLIDEVLAVADTYNLTLAAKKTSAQALSFLLRKLCAAKGQVVVLIDEYDAPILANLDDLRRVHSLRIVLREFYKVLKGSSSLIRFVFLTGISKFTKTGIFSALNNLEDISMCPESAAITGYTDQELAIHFSEYIKNTMQQLGYTEQNKFLEDVKNYYDGYSFDGQARVYNPYSIVNFFKTSTFKNFWYESGSSSSIATYFKKYKVDNPDIYRSCNVSPNFLSSFEIEKTSPESFFFQSGYLTITKIEESKITLDYPNTEIINSMAQMYMDYIYKIPKHTDLSESLWRSLQTGNIQSIIENYNIELSAIPYADFQNAGEGLYRAAFLLLLRSAKISAFSEVPTKNGRSDLIIETQDLVLILEFKLARQKNELESKLQEGMRQFSEKNYLTPYQHEKRKLLPYVIVINGEAHSAKAYEVKQEQ
ncbi:MAG: AAA family ATPase [Desulfovibrio sp.]|nr:AAA family ATPase [Desulfovibrio sp.]